MDNQPEPMEAGLNSPKKVGVRAVLRTLLADDRMSNSQLPRNSRLHDSRRHRRPSALIWFALCHCLWLSACSTARPWQNPPAAFEAVPPGGNSRTPELNADGIVAAVTLSGGGARAAAFGLGVLRELKDTRFNWQGRPTTLLDQVGLVSGVSGGSILAAHYAAFGDETLSRFEPDFLLDNVQANLFLRTLSPTWLYRLSSPWYGRSHVLAERLDRLYQGRSFGDLRARPNAPDLLVMATDLTTGAPFEFTPEQFRLICSDLSQVPLSFAVAASSSVPILLTPMTLRNHAGQCGVPGNTAAPVASSPDDSFRTRMLAAAASGYQDVHERPYVHLVDGGLADNLGVRSMLDRLLAGGSIRASFREAAPGSIHHLILIAVNSERDLADRIDRSDRVPSTGQMLDALLFGAGARDTQVTLAMLRDDMRRWQRELQQLRGVHDSPFAADVQMHVVSISLRDVTDPDLRRALLQVPTAFTIAPDDVLRLQEAGRMVLRQSPEFQQLRQALHSPELP